MLLSQKYSDYFTAPLIIGVSTFYNYGHMDSKNDPSTLIQHIEEVESCVKDAFINGLLFSKGSINIVELLSGRSEPLYILKVK